MNQTLDGIYMDTATVATVLMRSWQIVRQRYQRSDRTALLVQQHTHDAQQDAVRLLADLLKHGAHGHGARANVAAMPTRQGSFTTMEHAAWYADMDGQRRELLHVASALTDLGMSEQARLANTAARSIQMAIESQVSLAKLDAAQVVAA